MPTINRLCRQCTAALLAAAMALPAVAASDAPPHIARYIAEAQLAGSGRLTWFGFHVYDADLYAADAFDAREPTAQPFVLEVRYARQLSGASIAEASRDEMSRLQFGDDAQRAAWHAEMLRIFPDVRAGKRLAGVNLPGRGARFYFDGRFIGAIEDPAFARAFFAIWLDPRTKVPKLREQLLAGAARKVN